MLVQEIFASSFPPSFFVYFSSGTFHVSPRPKGSLKARRITLAHFFEEAVATVCSHFSKEKEARSFVRLVWKEEINEMAPWDLPVIVGEDGFIRYYAEGRPLSISCVKRIWKRLLEGPFDIPASLQPIYVGFNKNAEEYYDVKATPPGLLPKLFNYFRLKKDPLLLAQVQSDLSKVSLHSDPEERKLLTLAVLTFGACYRELEGKVLHLPSFLEKDGGVMIPYAFHHHFLWEGIKTISAFPLEKENEEPGFYLCQGTEIWPSQPSTLGTLFANLGREGSATEPYAYSWRQIHKHLRELRREGGPLPLVAGHSMGGALATQIALYSHPLISKAYAFNPPVVEERDYRVYHRLPIRAQEKLLVYANLDDLPFWRIGSKVIGKTTLFLTARRFKYRPVHHWELMLVLPALYKALINLIEAFPSHQNIYILSENYLKIPLSQEEIEKENLERVLRPDHLFFVHKLHSSAKALLTFRRKHFRWSKYEEYLESQLEILDLHEQDLHDVLSIEGGEGIEATLEEIHEQKKALQRMKQV